MIKMRLRKARDFFAEIKVKLTGLKNKYGRDLGEWSKIIFIVLMAVFVIVSLISVFPSGFTYSESEWKLKEDSALYYEGLTPDNTIVQEFEAEGSYLESVYLRFATFRGERQDGQITVTFAEKDGNVLYTESVDASKLPDGWDYDFQVKKHMNKGKMYVCTISAYSESGYSPAVWAGKPVSDIPTLTFGGEETDAVLICRFEYRHMDWIDYGLIVFAFAACVVFLFFKIPFGELSGRITGWVSLFVLPYVSFCMVEHLFQNPFDMPVQTVWYNYVIYLAVYVLAFVVTNRFRVAVFIGNTFTVAAGIANYYVLLYRGSPICPWDLYSIRTAADVAGGYNFSLTMEIIAVIMLMTAINIMAFSLKGRLHNVWLRVSLAVMAVVYTGGFYRLYCTTDFLKNEGYEANLWEQNRGYVQNGYFLSFAMNVQYLQVEKPEGYSTARVEEILDSCETEPVKQKVQQKPNIIMIMNEAFSDLSVIGDFDTNTEYLPFWNSLERNTVRGNLFVSIYGGGTANSEYEVLTGNTTAFLANGSIAYQQYINAGDTTGGMVRSLKDEGYTCYAMHPLSGLNWNRTNVYQAMGFDRFYELSAFENTTPVRDFISDFDTYRKIIELYENKEKDEPLFIFDVTVQNHGGYESGTQFEDPVELLGTTSYPKVNEYLSLIKISDDAFSYLIRYFEDVNEPTMIVMFGDHQPSVEEEFYESLEGKELKDWTLEEIEKRYEVPFIIWTNYDIESDRIDAISANYLGGLVYEYAGIGMPDYYSLMNQLREQLPVINSIGFMDSAGEWHSWEEADGESEYSELLERYRYLHYNSSVDKQGYNQNLYKTGRKQ